MTVNTGERCSIDQLLDTRAIEDVLSLHSRGLDRLDQAALQQCYWPEADVDYGSYKGSAHVFAELVVGALGSSYELTRHSLSNSLMAFEGDIAKVETNVTAGHLLLGGNEEMLFYGRYLDKLEKRDNQWKIMYRQVVMEWSKNHAVIDVRDSEAFADMAKAAHSPADPLYPFLQA